MSKIINKILNDKGLDVNSRVRLIQEWLKTDYRLKEVKDRKFLEQISEVHDHDNMALHFGEVNVGTAFEAGYVRIVELEEGWHLAFSRQSGQNFSIIHPSYEKAGVTAENLNTLSIVRNLIKKGSVKSLDIVAPAAESGAYMTVNGFEETVEDEDALVDNFTTTGSNGPTTSISINMDDYLK